MSDQLTADSSEDDEVFLVWVHPQDCECVDCWAERHIEDGL